MSTGILPDAQSGGVITRDGSGTPTNPSGVYNSYSPPSSFTSSCQLRALPSTPCAAKFDPAQINALVSEMLALAVMFNPTGAWTCASVQNLAVNFEAWMVARGIEDPAAFTALLASKLAKSGGIMTGALTLNGDASASLHAVPLQQVQNLLSGLRPKGSARCRTTADVSLSGGGLANGTVHDGVTVVTGNVVMVGSQAAPAENGLYIVPAAGSAARAPNMDLWTEVPGASVVIEEGMDYADSGWVCTANVGGTLGTTAITWTPFFGTGMFQAANALLTAISGLTMVADRMIYGTGAGTVGLATLTAFARSILDDADQAAVRSTLGLGSAALLTQAQAQQEVIVLAVSDEATAITTGAAKVTFRMPFAMTLTAVRASLTVASSSGNPAIDINEAGASIFATTLTIDATEKTSHTATTAAVLSDTSLADDAEMTIDIDTAGTGAKGLKVYLIGHRT